MVKNSRTRFVKQERAMRCNPIPSLGLAGILIVVLSGTAAAQGFALQIGPPVAAAAQPGAPVKKDALLFVVRPGGCSDPAAARITATAEGIVNGTRQSVTLTLAPLSPPGVRAVSRDMPSGGVWIVNLVGTCGGQTAGAIVAMAGPKPEYRREGVKLLTRAATRDEIEASLKALTTGGQQ
jgi:hypothetical protein